MNSCGCMTRQEREYYIAQLEEQLVVLRNRHDPNAGLLVEKLANIRRLHAQIIANGETCDHGKEPTTSPFFG